MRAAIITLTFLTFAGLVAVAGSEQELRQKAGTVLGIPDPATIDYPSGFPPTPAEVSLGKTLFFDPRLSVKKTVSCATCHNPDLGFGDWNAKGRGVNLNQLGRNSPHIYNLAWSPLFFWDGRAGSLEEQALGPIQAKGEMAMDLPELLKRLNSVSYYRQQVKAVYADDEVQAKHVASAIAAFERTLIVRQTAYDAWQAGNDHALGDEAKRGLALFVGKANCIACHSGPNLTDNSFHNLGVKDADVGRSAISPGKNAQGAFKTPGLRNCLLTAPYMHDGSLKSLEDVVRFYNRGGDQPTADPLVKPLSLSETEIIDLVAFLGVLTEPLVVERPAIP